MAQSQDGVKEKKRPALNADVNQALRKVGKRPVFDLNILTFQALIPQSF